MSFGVDRASSIICRVTSSERWTSGSDQPLEHGRG